MNWPGIQYAGVRQTAAISATPGGHGSAVATIESGSLRNDESA